jgi:hypothetical protein
MIGWLILGDFEWGGPFRAESSPSYRNGQAHALRFGELGLLIKGGRCKAGGQKMGTDFIFEDGLRDKRWTRSKIKSVPIFLMRPSNYLNFF